MHTTKTYEGRRAADCAAGKTSGSVGLGHDPLRLLDHPCPSANASCPGFAGIHGPAATDMAERRVVTGSSAFADDDTDHCLDSKRIACQLQKHLVRPSVFIAPHGRGKELEWPHTSSVKAVNQITGGTNGIRFQGQWQGGALRCPAEHPAVVGDPRGTQADRHQIRLRHCLCGACMVHIEGKRAFSCQTQVSQVAGKAVTTIEALSPPPSHPIQTPY